MTRKMQPRGPPFFSYLGRFGRHCHGSHNDSFLDRLGLDHFHFGLLGRDGSDHNRRGDGFRGFGFRGFATVVALQVARRHGGDGQDGNEGDGEAGHGVCVRKGGKGGLQKGRRRGVSFCTSSARQIAKKPRHPFHAPACAALARSLPQS